MVAFEDLFAYHHHFNQKLGEELEAYTEVIPKRTLNKFCHILNAHHIWNARILDAEPKYGVNTDYSLDEAMKLDKVNYQETLGILKDRVMNEVLEYQNSKGQTFRNSLSDILFHIVNHTTHHRGQIISDFRHFGVPPLVTDYIFYKR